jgi:hypothetical protein
MGLGAVGASLRPVDPISRGLEGKALKGPQHDRRSTCRARRSTKTGVRSCIAQRALSENRSHTARQEPVEARAKHTVVPST